MDPSSQPGLQNGPGSPWSKQDGYPMGPEEIVGGEGLDRPTSAPPVLELAKDALFAFRGTSDSLLDVGDQLRLGFQDIRLHPSYERFYQLANDPTLPPPLERSQFASSSLGPDNDQQGMTGMFSLNSKPPARSSLDPFPRSSRIEGLSVDDSLIAQLQQQQRLNGLPSPVGRPQPRSPAMSGTQPLGGPYGPIMQGVANMNISGPVPPLQNSFGAAPGSQQQYGAPHMRQSMFSAQSLSQNSPFGGQGQGYFQGNQMPQYNNSVFQQPVRHQSVPAAYPAPSANQPSNRGGGSPAVGSGRGSPKSKRRQEGSGRRSEGEAPAQIWSPPMSQRAPASAPQEVPRGAGFAKNKNIGKVAINADTNLSSSTEDLLLLAGKSHLRLYGQQQQNGGFGSAGSTPNDTPRSDDDDPQPFSPSAPFRSPLAPRQSNPPAAKRKSAGPASPQPSYADPLAMNSDLAMMRPSAITSPSQHPPTPAGAIVVPALNMNVPKLQMSGGPTSPTPSGSSSHQVCRYYAQGYCSRGDKCNFLHTNDPSILGDLDLSPKDSGRRSPRLISSPSRYVNMNIEDCVGQVHSMCKDQHGCRFLQRKLDEDPITTVSVVFAEVSEHIVELMGDPFGNYLCQKLIEHCNTEQRLAIVRGVASHLVAISKNMHGTRAVQKTIEHLGSSEEIRLIREALKGSVVGLIQDLNGNHVIQKCIHKMEPNDNQFIYDAVAQHCIQVATHRHGCCVMQRCIDHASDQQKLQLVTEIKNHALSLVQDAFGNYVVQYVLDLGMEDICEALAKNLGGHLFYLSTQKFSSNVVEKCLKVGNARTVQFISKELAEYNHDMENPVLGSTDEEPLVQLLQHPYGNYVVQTALQESQTKANREWHMMVARIKPYLPNLRTTPYVKRIQALLSPQKPNAPLGPTDGHRPLGPQHAAYQPRGPDRSQYAPQVFATNHGQYNPQYGHPHFQVHQQQQHNVAQHHQHDHAPSGSITGGYSAPGHHPRYPSSRGGGASTRKPHGR